MDAPPAYTPQQGSPFPAYAPQQPNYHPSAAPQPITRERIQYASQASASLLATLSATDNAPAALPQQTTYITELESNLNSLSRDLGPLEAKTKKELKEHQSYSSSKFKKAVYGMGGSWGKNKFDTRASKEEEELAAAWHKEQTLKNTIEQTKTMLEEARAEKARLEGQVKQHNEAQKQLDELYAGLFDGPTPQDPREDQLEQYLRRMKEALAEAAQKSKKADTAIMLVQEAQTATQQSQTACRQAEMASDMDMMGSTSANWIKRQDLNQVQMLLERASHKLDMARMNDPAVGQLPVIRVPGGHVMGDILFDNIFSDMSFSNKIWETHTDIMRALQVMGQEVGAVQERAVEVKGRFEEEKKEVERARRELQEQRSRLLEALVSHGGAAPPGY